MSPRAITPAQMARFEAQSRRWYAVTPPEGVTVRFEVASIVSRFGAQILDLLMVTLLLIAVSIVLWYSPLDFDTFGVITLSILLLLTRAPYYIITELLWNGRTLGKRIVGLRVIGADGRGLTTHAVVSRNLMKEVEVFAPATFLLAAGQLGWIWSLVLLVWITVLIIVPAVHPRRQRIGDILANTVVVTDPRPVLAPELVQERTGAPGQDEFVFTEAQRGHYGRFELQTLESFLRAHPLTATPSEPDPAVIAVTAQIIKKISYEEPVPDERALAFLHAFYAAQRAYLERRKLYGDEREDKHHAEARKSDE